jgi:SAM-dependent methyltransferase
VWGRRCASSRPLLSGSWSWPLPLSSWWSWLICLSSRSSPPAGSQAWAGHIYLDAWHRRSLASYAVQKGFDTVVCLCVYYRRHVLRVRCSEMTRSDLSAMVKLDLHYVDPRLVELYDHDNPRGADTDFYLALATELGAHRILDLGCGTGVLTRELAAVDGRYVIGVDPASAMLAIARRPPDAERVHWIEGDATALGTLQSEMAAVDLVVMTGNVAQVFLDDTEWAATLRAIDAVLRPGGHLAFESRNPDDCAWERWTRDATYDRID